MKAALICEALRRRCLLRFRYKDHSTLTVVEPYTYGETSAGNNALSAWLVSGETKDATPPLWRIYRESEMKHIEILEDTFAENRAGYNPWDSRFRLIRCRVG